MKRIRLCAIVLLAVLTLVAAPVLPLSHTGEALARSSRTSDQNARSSVSRRGKRVRSPKVVTVAKHRSRTSAARKGRHARRPAVEAENEEGDIGVCTVPTLRVKSAILYDVTTGRVLYEQNPDFQIAPASLTKIITLYLIFDAIRRGQLRPWDVVHVSSHASTQGGSNMRLRTGEDVKVTELIKGIAVASANDACMAMAEYLESGNAETFVSLMNTTAKHLGMTNTMFMNPNGLPADGQLTTARDMLKLATAYLNQFPKALTIHSMQFFTHNNRQRHNANPLLAHYKGADGLKTGFVCSSGYNIIATAKRGDTRLIAVVLGSRNAGVRARETARLLDKGFKMAELKQEPDRSLAAAPVTGVQPQPESVFTLSPNAGEQSHPAAVATTPPAVAVAHVPAVPAAKPAP